MKSLPDNSGQIGSVPVHLSRERGVNDGPRSLGPPRWDWDLVRKVLVVRLRSIGDTVLATPSLYALRRFLPKAQIDILLEDWVAPLLEGSDLVDSVVTIRRDNASRFRAVRQLRQSKYDVAYNLHGGTTASFLTRASGATHRVGYATYQYSSFNNHVAPSPAALWKRQETHSVEQQLGLPGWTGVPVSDRPRASLAITPGAALSISKRLNTVGVTENERFALIHPSAAFATKQWDTKNFARVVEHVAHAGISSIAVAAPGEEHVLSELRQYTSSAIHTFSDLSLPEVTALAKRATIFVGNDSGIAHIAAAVETPAVVIFGSSNITHWRPWATVPAEAVWEALPCQPCPGYTCSEFDMPECIRRVTVESVTSSIDRVLKQSSTG